MEGEHQDPQLVEAVKKQVEYYFSRENLANDAYLTSQMDAQMSVALSVIMKFAKLKALTQDENLVRRALADSTVVSIVDGNRIKANIKASGRSTIILRDIASDAPEEEVKEIFNYPGCKPISSIRSDIGDTWFVVMETEEDAKDTALDLKLKKRTFRGQPVKARIKTEAVVRSFFPVQPVPPIPAVFPVMPFAPIVGGPIEMVPFGYVGVPPVAEGAVVVDTTTPAEATQPTEVKPAEENAETSQAAKTATSTTRASTRSDPRRTSTRTTGTTRDTAAAPEGRRPRTEGTARRSTETARVSSTGKEREKKSSEQPVNKAPIEINAISFPPLQAADETPVPTPGYKDTYVKYTMDDIIAIVKNVKEANLPTDLDADLHSLAITATPNMDLLKRQRTFSIDETREQLRQGRPVLKDAIIPGAVDYKSMMYGDDTHHSAHKTAAVATKKTESAPEIKQPETAASSSSEPKPELGLTSPARLNSATWAAMVKSSAPVPLVEAGPVPPVPAPKAAPKVAAEPKKAPTAPKSEANQKDNKEKEKSSSSRKEKGGEQKEKKSNNKSRGGDEKKKDKDSDESKKAENNEKKTEEASVEVATSSWGGKASFANILKQTLPEEPAAATEVPKQKPTPVPSNNKKSDSSHNNKLNNSDAKKGSNNGFNRDRGNRDSKRSSNADADGMWVKETLPALPEK